MVRASSQYATLKKWRVGKKGMIKNERKLETAKATGERRGADYTIPAVFEVFQSKR